MSLDLSKRCCLGFTAVCKLGGSTASSDSVWTIPTPSLHHCRSMAYCIFGESRSC